MVSEFAYTLAVTLGFILCNFGWGALLCGRHLDADLPEFLVSRFVIGMAAVYAACIFLSAAGVMVGTPIAAILIIGAALAILQFETLGKKIVAASAAVTGWKLVDRILLGTVVTVALIQLITGLSPLIFYDSLLYHMAAPAEFLRHGTLVHVPWNESTDSPLALQLAAGTTLAFDETGASFKLTLTLLGCLMPLSAALLMSEAGVRGSLWAALFVLSYPEFWVQQSLGVVDLGAAAMVVLGTCWLYRSLQTHSWKWLIPAGFAFGFAVGSRYQDAPLVAIIVVVLVARFGLNLSVVRSVAVVALLIVIVLLPWVIRAGVGTGNPFFPLMQGTLGGRDWSSEQAQIAWRDAMGASFQELSLVQKIMAPVGVLLITPGNGLFGLALLLASLMVLQQRRAGIARVSAVIGIAGVLVWGFIKPDLGEGNIRYNAASLVFLLAASAGFLLSSTRVCALLSSGSLVLALAHANSVVPVWRTITNEPTRLSFYRNQLPSWEAFDYVNSQLDRAGNKLLFIGETRGFPSRIPAIVPGPFNGPQLEKFFFSLAGPQQWSSKLREQGVTHILISRPEWQRLNERYGYFPLTKIQSQEFGEWLARQKVVFDDGRGTAVLEVR